ncbi:hypothetical protein HETIRDRAFT_114845 [Heterobasidion irregulare TC 32-1]|uniref:Uncharacterized protein n=1 Tax=Heterobasidion irregulare (strain TC 32-1) TaxID=747525 RepID=W4KK94_HETIT|nr:uncharacterized protein HETIRDRAFT_114845 [Heterobasidion irregulare TC 32-1]ETW86267.1 hypothetical protein HETIRDRAFT_114845 [Heterobasidion irregulare TC 32-1]
MTSYSSRIHDHRSSRVSRYHPYPRVRAPRHHSGLSMLPPQPAALAGEAGDLEVEAEKGVEEGVEGGVGKDAAVERRPVQPGLAVLGGHLLAFVTAVWRRWRM